MFLMVQVRPDPMIVLVRFVLFSAAPSGCMAVAKKLAAYDTGYDKKFDAPTQSQAWMPAHNNARSWSLFRKRRLAQSLLALIVVYLFIKYLPTDLPTSGQRIDSRTGLRQGPTIPVEYASNKNVLERSQLYDGQVRFYNLAVSLRPHIHALNGDKRSLVFLLRDLRSAASLVQLACQMGSFKRTIVHLAVISPQDTSIPDIVSLVGINSADCPVYWHDARPDYNAQSSSARQIRSVQSAMDHLHASLQTSAFVVDEAQVSDPKFKAIVQEKSRSLWIPLMIAPREAAFFADWITSLDGYAFSFLNNIKIDILINAYHSSAGSLVKLLQSIRTANYGGLPPPRITVELPYDIDNFALKYLEDFSWPANTLHEGERLVLRKRLDSQRHGPISASAQVLESFYPSSTYASHLLVLSPDVELSTEYFQYLMYTISEYKYGISGLGITNSLMGISLNLPSKLSDMINSINKDAKKSHPLLMSHTPTSTAALYLGDKWAELQNYVSLRLKNDPILSKTIPGHIKLSETQPAWLHLASEFMIAGNYVMLYPAFAQDQASQLVTVHKEFHQDPEEYTKLAELETEKPKAKPIPPLKDNSILVADEEETTHAHLGHKQMNKPVQSLRSRMGIEGYDSLPSSLELPFVAPNGKHIEFEDARRISHAFANELSLSVGGCRSLEDRDDKTLGRVEYLFCFYDEQRVSA